MQVSKKSLEIGAASALLLALVAASLWLFGSEFAIVGTLITSTAIVLALACHWKEESSRRFAAISLEFDDIRSHQALSVVPLASPMPWSSCTLPAVTIAQALFEVRARNMTTIVECGCGISTVYLAWMMKHMGRGKVYAIENEREWAELVQSLVDENELSDYVSIVHAPIESGQFDSREMKWYATRNLQEVQSLDRIDLLLVDGPTQKSERFARYPAVPAFWDQLHADSVIILDDTGPRRKGSRRETKYDTEAVVEMWLRDFPLTVRLFRDRHGHAVFSMKDMNQDRTNFQVSSSMTTRVAELSANNK